MALRAIASEIYATAAVILSCVRSSLTVHDPDGHRQGPIRAILQAPSPHMLRHRPLAKLCSCRLGNMTQA